MTEPNMWPADKVERWPVERLILYARNARTHSEAQIAQIAASIREWGWTNPVLVDEGGGVIAGHGRILAARQLGVTDVPVMVARGWTEAQKQAYVLADNKLALNAGWDDSLLRIELADLAEMNFDLSLTGFAEQEIAALSAAGNLGLTDPDDAPEPPAQPVSVLGDVWVLGRHRLVCGDSTDADTVAKALNGGTPHLMVTDPPYGVNYDPGWRNREGVPRQHPGKSREQLVDNDDRVDWSDAYALFPGDVAYVWHSGTMANVTAKGLIISGFEIRAQIIWTKQQFVFGRGHYHPQHEPCLYVVRKGRAGHWSGDRKQSTVWAISSNRGFFVKDGADKAQGHSTQKPVECMKRPIENNSSPGQAVYEPFNGSGTTIIAAEMTGRACHAIELNPAYVDVAVRRWQDFSGKVAILEATGESFEQVAEKRDRFDAGQKAETLALKADHRESGEARA